MKMSSVDISNSSARQSSEEVLLVSGFDYGANSRPHESNGDGSSHGEDDFDDDDEEAESSVIASIFYANGRVAAAAFDYSSFTLQVLEDKDDVGPFFNVTRSILTQLNPQVLVLSSKQNVDFVEIVKAICGCKDVTVLEEDVEEEKNDEEDELKSQTLSPEENSPKDVANQPMGAAVADTELIIMPGKHFRYESSKRKILSLRLIQESELDFIEEEHHNVMINSLLNLNSEVSVRTIGGLLAVLEVKNYFKPGNDPLLSITGMQFENVLQIDETTFNALQIFSVDRQAAASRSGSWNKSREGLSVFKILNRCRSVLGSKFMRFVCRCPLRIPEVIKRRQDAVAFLSNPSQSDIFSIFSSCLRNVKNVPKLLKKLSLNQATAKDWKNLKITIKSLLRIIETCSKISKNLDGGAPHIIEQFSDCGSAELYCFADLINTVFNEEESLIHQRFIVNAGIDEDLDRKRRLHNGLPDLLDNIISVEVKELPDMFQQCFMLYMPQIGYLLGIERKDESITDETIASNVGDDCEILFDSEGTIFLKTRRCRELDVAFGDSVTNIMEHETQIMIRIAGYILKNSNHILAPARYASELDVLLSFAMVASEKYWVQPELITDGETFEIENGRHPLMELCCDTFVPNSTIFGDNEKMMVLTGPNACGKSIYLKQVGIIAYLAHLGCFVPAHSAKIPVIDQIFSRVQTLESVSLGLSAFAVDLDQISKAVRCATKKSLILIDEFGKGTCEVDGQALLAGCLRHILSTIKAFTFVSTHFSNVVALMGDLVDFICFKTFDYMLHGSAIVFLHKIKPGICKSSHALAVAQEAGIPDRILQRSQEILDCIQEGKPVCFNEDVYPMEDVQELVNFFLEHLDLEDKSEVKGFMETLKNTHSSTKNRVLDKE